MEVEPADSSAERRSERLFVGIALVLLTALGLFQIYLGERVPAGDGQGWDGRFYVWFIQDFGDILFGRQLDEYRLQRILPSLIVKAALTLADVEPADRHIVRAFAFLNLAALLGTLLAWNGICRSLAISIAGRWLGFLLIFVNFACLRMPFYIPVITDPSAFFLGALLVYGYVRDSGAVMLTALALGALTWPSFLVLGAFLYCLRRDPLPPAAPSRRLSHWFLGASLALLYLLGLALFFLWPVPVNAPRIILLQASLLPLSAPLVAGYLLLGYAILARNQALFRLDSYARAFDTRRFLHWCCLALCVALALASLSSGERPPAAPSNYVRHLFVEPVFLPALSFLGHVVYWGVLPLTLVFYWPRATEAAHRLGIGFTLFIGAVFLQTIAFQSRQMVHGAVAFALLAVLAVERVRWPSWAPFLLTGLALLASKLWFGINHEGFSSKSHFLSYPAQYHFMQFGAWMSREMYALQGSVALVAALLFALVYVNARPLAAGERIPIQPSPAVLVRVCWATAVVVALAVGVEALARQALLRQRARQDAASPAQPDAVLGWRNVPGSELRLSTGQREVALSFNAHGLRGPDRAYSKTPGIRRILLLGGSCAEGAGVDEGSSFRSLLERRLAATGCGRIEVVNGGVAGYSTAQQARFFAEAGSRYEPDVVLVVFASEDLALGGPVDEESAEPEPAGTSVPRGLRGPRWAPAYPWRGSAALRVFSNFTSEHAPSLHRRLSLLGIVERREPPRALWPFGIREEVKAAWERTEETLAQLAQETRSRGARLALLHCPERVEVDEAAWADTLERYRMSPRFWRPGKVSQRLAAVAESISAPLVELREPFARAPRSPALFLTDGLWSEAAHEIAASEAARRLPALLACPASTSTKG